MTSLPVATSSMVWKHARRLLLRHPGALATTLGLHSLAAATGLAAPRLLGDLVANVQDQVDTVTLTVALIAGCVLAQCALLALAVYSAARLTQRLAAELREDFVRDVLDLPLSRVERAGAGDLLSRSTRDADTMAQMVRDVVPGTLIALTTMVITVGALALVGWLMIIPCLTVVPLLLPVVRWYLARARPGYLRARAAYAHATEVLTETVEGARTVEALRIAPRRISAMDQAIAEAYRAERYTMWLRTVLLPISDTAMAVPTVATLVFGGICYSKGWVSLAGVTAATFYAQQLAGQLDMLLYYQDKLQAGGAALARLLGVSLERPENTRAVAETRESTGPAERDIQVTDVRYAYSPGQDVLHAVNLKVSEGERIAIVGPSGAGKTTLGRLIAGIDQPRTGSVTLGGTPLADLPRQKLRSEIALVTQEHHIFQGSVRDNLLLASPEATEAQLQSALEAVGATGWVAELGIDTQLGRYSRELSPAEAQQVSLARLILTDPHTLLLDEATSLLDQTVARQLERSLAALMRGRTVISIAHRLHTAHDADRVVVMADGRIVENGSHDELLQRGGTYAALWYSWHHG